ncbi:MAG: hypothetical protein Q8P41_20390 [Pseudomonadota bacterium]|nr:hypothetical protein [Pseudomonadota bacterium]
MLLMAILWLIVPDVHAACSTANNEDGRDAYDDDCDGYAAVRRDYVHPMDSSITTDFAIVNGGTISDSVALVPTATQTATMKSNGTIS